MPLPTLNFLLSASQVSLQDLELASLNRASNLGKAVSRDIDEWVEQLAAAMMARWMMDNREALLAAGAQLSTEADLRDKFAMRKKTA